MAGGRRRGQVDRLPGRITAGGKPISPAPGLRSPSGIEGMQVIVVDSEERRDYEQAMSQRMMERTRESWRSSGNGSRRAAEATREDRCRGRATAAAESRLPVLSVGHPPGRLPLLEHEADLAGEKSIECLYVIATSESGCSVLDVVGDLHGSQRSEAGFRQLKDVLAMRPIYRQIEPRVKATSS